jgi:hypothetical protein
MNDQNKESIPNPNPSQSTSGSQPTGDQGSTPPPVYQDWREQRRAERLARHEARWQRHAGHHYGWIGGIFLILLGVVFLLQNMGIPFLTNWWALFILILAFWAYVRALEVYQDDKRLTRRGAGSLIIGILLTILAFAFLFNLNFNLFWPILLIVGGLVLLLTGFLPE